MLIKGEEFLLLEQSNNDWWKCLREGEHKPMYVPANYVEIMPSKGKHTVTVTLSSGSQDGATTDQNANTCRLVNESKSSAPGTPTDDVFILPVPPVKGRSVESLDTSSDVCYVNLDVMKSLTFDQENVVNDNHEEGSSGVDMRRTITMHSENNTGGTKLSQESDGRSRYSLESIECTGDGQEEAAPGIPDKVYDGDKYKV